MAIEIDTSVSVIEGIGPATAEALGQAGIHTVYDLLRTNVAAIRAAAGSLASEDEVRRWRRMASLLQLAEVTPQWAEALVHGGVDAIDELHGKRLDELDALFRDAVEAGIAPSAPELPQIAEMLKDAGVLRHTGALVGLIMGPDGHPAASATLRIAGREYPADARGRFRVLRIPLGRKWPLIIEHPDFAPVSLESASVEVDSDVVGGTVFTLGASGSTPAEPEMLSELAGDALPASWDRVRQVALEPAQLREHDLVTVSQFYQTVPDVLLVSLLRSWQRGDLFVHTLRVPRSVLPAGARVNDQFRVAGSALEPVQLTPLDVHRYRIDLRVRKAFAGRPRPETNEEWVAHMREQFQFRAANGYYVYPGRTS